MTLSTSTVTLAPGSSRTYTLAPGEAVTVATEPNCFVTVTETPDVIASADLDGQTNVRTSVLQYKGEWTYGPYALGGTVAVAVSLSKSTSSVSVTLGSAAAAVVGAAGAYAGRHRVAFYGDSMALFNHHIGVPTSIVRVGGVSTVTVSQNACTNGFFKISGTTPASFDTNKVAVTRLTASTYSYPNPGPDESATAFGHSTALGWLANISPFLYANGLLNGALTPVFNFGVGGQTSAQILARVSEVTAVGPAGTREADEVWLFAGTNDAVAGVAASVTTANYAQIVSRLKAAGYSVRFMTVPPFGSGLSGLAAASALVVQYNTWIKANGARYGYIPCDVFGVMTDGTNANGAAKSGYLQSDNTHLTALGALMAGTEIASTYDSSVAAGASILTTSQNDGYATSPLLPNIWTSAPWTNSGGTISDVVSGTAADGYNISSSGNAGRTAVASVVSANTGLGFAQRVVFTPAANNDTVTIQQESGSVMAARILPGEQYEFKVYLRLTNVSGSNLLYIRNRIQGTFDGVSGIQMGSAIHNQNTTTGYSADMTLVLRSPVFVIPPGVCTAMTSELIFGFSASGTAVTIDVERVSMDRVQA